MGKSKIEWLKNADGSQGYTLNPVKGKCPVACSYCYARRLYDRFKWEQEIRYIGRDKLFDEILKIPRGRKQKIFIGSTIELFGDWIEPYWMKDIFEVVNTFSFFTFIFLTKQPQNLVKWSPFPPNVWVGVSATDYHMYSKAMLALTEVKASIRFLSIEPLLDWTNLKTALPKGIIDWLIIGSQTQPIRHPKPEWVREIIEAADKARIPVFVKEPLASHMGIQRQEFSSGADLIRELRGTTVVFDTMVTCSQCHQYFYAQSATDICPSCVVRNEQWMTPS